MWSEAAGRVQVGVVVIARGMRPKVEREWLLPIANIIFNILFLDK